MCCRFSDVMMHLEIPKTSGRPFNFLGGGGWKKYPPCLSVGKKLFSSPSPSKVKRKWSAPNDWYIVTQILELLFTKLYNVVILCGGLIQLGF